jgi:hypothetical protein
MIIVNCNFYVASFIPITIGTLGITRCVSRPSRTLRSGRALFSVLTAAGLLNFAKSDADFGGQRYVKQAEFCGLSEG